MNSSPGRLTGSGIRPLPAHMLQGIMRRLKEDKGRGFRIKSARYRVSGFRDPESGDWVSRNPRNGHYYRVKHGKHTTQIRPTPLLLNRSNMLSLEVEIDRGKGPRIFYVSLPK